MCIDPLAEDYSYQSPYNFSENRVIDGIELEGLEFVPINGNGIRDSFISTIGQEPTNPQKTMNQDNLINGISNTFFGLVGTIGSVIYIGGTEGAGAALGGTVALEMSLGEMAIGIAQISDALTNNSGNINLQNSNTIPGLIANQNDSSFAPLIDGVGAFLPGTLTGGNLNAIWQTPNSIANSTTTGQVAFNAASGIDAVLDTQSVINAGLSPQNTNSTNSNINNTSSTTSSKAPVVDNNIGILPEWKID